MEITFVLVLMLLAVVLFSLETVPVEVVALGILTALILSGVLTPQEALAGFANEAVIVIGGLFVITAGLRTSGALDALGRLVERAAARGAGRALALLLVTVAGASAFMSNTTTTAVFLPIGLALAKSGSLSPGRVFMPLAFASILGGSITLFGTSTNLIVSGLLPRWGEAPLGLFELLPVALPIALLGLVYLLVAAPRLLPERGGEETGDAALVRQYLAEITVLEGSPLLSRTVAEAALGRRHDLNLLAILSGGVSRLPEPGDRFAAGDQLLVESHPDRLLAVAGKLGLALPGALRRPPRLPADTTFKLTELVVLPRSELVGRTLAETRFRQRFGASVIALHRHADAVLEKLAGIPLRVGDVLLAYGESTAVERLLAQRGLLVLSHRTPPSRPRFAALMAGGVFLLTVILAASGVVALSGAVLLGCFLLFISRASTPQEAYAAIEWRLLILIAGMLGFGTALVETGAASWLADAVIEVLGDLGPRAVLAAFYLLTLILTQPMSNQAAALVVLPVALEAAVGIGLAPRAMAVTVALAASNSFLTPLEPSCLLVYGPGRYRFLDFARLGAGLTVIAFLLVVLLVPWVWPVTP